MLCEQRAAFWRRAGAVSLIRFRGHPRWRENAPGVADGTKETKVVHARVKGRSGAVVVTMPIIQFSRARLTRTLDRLAPHLRVVFVAACAERLLSACVSFSVLAKKGNSEVLTRSLARLWKDVAGESMTEDEMQASIDAYTALIPTDDELTSDAEEAYAQEAISALIYALTSSLFKITAC